LQLSYLKYTAKNQCFLAVYAIFFLQVYAPSYAAGIDSGGSRETRAPYQMLQHEVPPMPPAEPTHKVKTLITHLEDYLKENMLLNEWVSPKHHARARSKDMCDDPSDPPYTPDSSDNKKYGDGYYPASSHDSDNMLYSDNENDNEG